jgi:hypothetical protein
VLEADREGFGLEAAAETGQLAVTADDALARDQDRQRVGGVGLAFRPLGATVVLVVRVLMAMFAGAALVAAVGSRLWHFAWGVFAAIAVLLWLGTR